MHLWRRMRKIVIKPFTISFPLIVTNHLVSSSDTTPRWHLYRNVQRDPISPTSYCAQPPKFDLKLVQTKVPIQIYVVDSGVKITHDEFEGRASYGRSIIDNSDIADDCQGHGTHVAALAAGKTSGIAKQAKIISVKILDCRGAGFCSDVTAAMMWVLDHHERTNSPASVVVMSVGSRDAKCEPTARAADEMAAAGIIIAAAAGNSGSDACTLFPAKNRATIAVGATDIDDELYAKSNFGECVEILAPGVRVLSAWGAGNNETTLRITGTSMSAPQVGATAALIKAANPNFTVNEVKNILLESSTKDAIYAPGGRELMKSSANRLLHTPWSRLFMDLEIDSAEGNTNNKNDNEMKKIPRISTTKTTSGGAALAIELELTPSTYPAMKYSVDRITKAIASITSSVSLKNITATRKPGSELRSDGTEPETASLRFYIRVPETKLTSMITMYKQQTQDDRLQKISGESFTLGPNSVVEAEPIIRGKEDDVSNKPRLSLILGIVACVVGTIFLIGLILWRGVVRWRTRVRRDEHSQQNASEETGNNPAQVPEPVTAQNAGST